MEKTNVDILREANLLDDIANRLGMDDNNFDGWEHCDKKQRIVDKINDADSKQIMMWWSGWHIGDEYWADKIITKYEELKEARGEK